VLRQRQSLDAGGGGLAQRAAATVELAEGDNGFAFPAAASLALLAPLQAAFFDQLPAEAGVAQMIGGEIDQGHDFLASEMGKPPPKDRDNNLEQVGPWLQDPLGGISDVGLGPHRQR